MPIQPSDPHRTPPRLPLSRRRAALWLALIYPAAVVLRFAARNLQGLPYIYNDEMILLEGARSILRGTGVWWGAQPFHYPSWLYPLAVAPAVAALAPEHAVRGILALNALLINAAIPLTYALARRSLDRPRALTAAGLTALMTSMIYASTVMAENVFFPLWIAAFLAGLKAMRRPTVGRRLIAGALFGLLYHAKPQGLYFPFIFALAVLADARTACGLTPAQRLAAAGRHWLTALAWAAVAGLRLVAAWREGMADPLSFDAFLGGYAMRARGEFPFNLWAMMLMTYLNASVLFLICGLWPAMRLVAALPRVFAGRGSARRRPLILLTAAAIVVVVLASARHTIVVDRQWMVYERYQMILIPPLFVVMLLGRPDRLTDWRTAGLRVRSAAVLGVAGAVLGAMLFTYWRRFNLATAVPSFQGSWLVFSRREAARPALALMLVVVAVAPLALATIAATRSLARWRPRLPALGVAWLFLVFNFGAYASHNAIVRDIVREDVEFARHIRRKLPADARLIILTDRMSSERYFRLHFLCPGLPVRIVPSDEYWFAAPLKFAPGGRPLPPDDKHAWWLLAARTWPFVGEAVDREDGFELFDLAANPPVRMDLEALNEKLQGTPIDIPPPGNDGFPAGFDLTWMRIEPPRRWRAGETVTIRLTLRNDSPFVLLPDPRRFAIGYHWGNHTLTGDWNSVVWEDGNYAFLPEDLRPGQTVVVKLPVQTPDTPHDDWLLTLAPVMLGDEERLWSTVEQRNRLLPARIHPAGP